VPLQQAIIGRHNAVVKSLIEGATHKEMLKKIVEQLGVETQNT
jgi:hypothetical protein